MEEVLLELFSKVVEEIEFGGRSEEVMFEGKLISIPVASDKMFQIGLKDIVQNPFNALSGGLLAKHQLIEPAKRAAKLNELIRVEI